MIVKESADPAALFDAFVADHGAEKIARCYRLALAKFNNEQLFEVFNDAGERVGWMGLIHSNPTTRSTRVGVFTAHERQGWRKRMVQYLADLAFSDPAVQVINTSVQATNPPQVIRMIRRHLAGSAKIVSAEYEPTPTIRVEISRETWEKMGYR
jgi:hypothetical protein